MRLHADMEGHFLFTELGTPIILLRTTIFVGFEMNILWQIRQ